MSIATTTLQNAIRVINTVPALVEALQGLLEVTPEPITMDQSLAVQNAKLALKALWEA